MAVAPMKEEAEHGDPVVPGTATLSDRFNGLARTTHRTGTPFWVEVDLGAK